MKTLVLHKVISFVLSFLVFFSTLSLTIEKHFCGDTLIDVAIFSEIEKCGTDEFEMQTSETIKKSCCKDEIDILQGLNQASTYALEDVEEVQEQSLFVYRDTYIKFFESLPHKIISYKRYGAPIIVKDIQVLNETFLI